MLLADLDVIERPDLPHAACYLVHEVQTAKGEFAAGDFVIDIDGFRVEKVLGTPRKKEG